MGATYRKDTYKGINVDIRTNYLTDAVAVEVKVDRSAGGPVVKTAKTPTLALLNTGATGGTTAPIVIQSGTYNEAGSGSWNMPTATWTAGTLPTSVTVTITRANGSTLVKTVSLGEVAGPHATRSEVMPANQAPVGSVTSPVNGDTAGTANGKLVVKGLVNDDLGQMNYVYAQLVKPGVSGGLVQGYHHMVYQNPGAWTIELNVASLGLTDGAYGLNIKYMDMQGNMSQERVDFVIDNTFPTFAINSPVNGSYVRGTVNLKAEIKDANDISKVLMNIGGISRSWNEGASTTITRTSNIFATNVDTTTLPDGAIHTTLRGTDGVGNVRYWNNNAATRQHVFYVDNTAPEVVTQTVPVNNAYITNGKLNLRFTVSDSGSGVKQVNIHIFQNNTTMLIVPLQHMGGDTWGVDGYDISSLADGTYSFVSRAQDNVGNTRVGTGTNHGTIIVDTTAPILTNVSLDKIVNVAGTNYTSAKLNNGKLRVTFTSNEPLKLVGTQAQFIGAINGNSATHWAHAKATGNTNEYYADIDLANFVGTDGLLLGKVFPNLQLRLRLVDLANNVHSTYYATDASGNTIQDDIDNVNDSRNVKITLDNVSPVASIEAPEITRSVNSLIKGVSTDQGSGVKSHWFEIIAPNGNYYYVNGVSQFNLADAKDNTPAKNPIVITDGEYRIRYVAEDHAKNRNDDPNYSNSAIHRMTIDTAAPDAPTITTPGARQYLNGAGVLNGWTAVADAVEYEVKYEFVGRATAYRTVAAPATSRTQTFSGTYQGPITISVRAKDAAGNWSAYSKSVTYNYDSINPETTIAVSDVVDGKFTVSGDATDKLRLNRVYVQLVSRVTGLRCGGTTISFVSANTNTSSWSVDYDLATLGANCPEGDFAAHVEVADMAGNRGSKGWTQNFMVAAPAPVEPTEPEPNPNPNPADPANPTNLGGSAAPTAAGAFTGSAFQRVVTLPTEEADDATEEDVLGAVDVRDTTSREQGEVLADTDVRKEWSLVNVILAGVTALISLIALAGIRKDSEKKAKVLRVLTLVPAIGAVVAVLLIEDFSAKLGWFNVWTTLFAAIIVVQAIVMASSKPADD
jgi:hypothetical protein